eukprot:gene23487-biopygen7294
MFTPLVGSVWQENWMCRSSCVCTVAPICMARHNDFSIQVKQTGSQFVCAVYVKSAAAGVHVQQSSGVCAFRSATHKCRVVEMRRLLCRTPCRWRRKRCSSCLRYRIHSIDVPQPPPTHT